MKSKIIKRKVLMVRCAPILAGAFLALSLLFQASAQTTLFSDNFQDGDASAVNPVPPTAPSIRLTTIL